MLRQLILAAALLVTAGCGKALELASQTKTVAAPREEVFTRMFGKDGGHFSELPLVTNGGSTRLHELVVHKGEPGFESLAPNERPEAEKVRLAVTMEIPRETHILYNVDDGALMTGLKFTFEELAPGRTRVAFTIDNLTGHGSEGLMVNTIKLRALARAALNRLDDFEEVPGTA